MRKAKRSILLTVAATMLFSTSAYAMPPVQALTWSIAERPTSIGYVDYKKDAVNVAPRGEILSTGMVTIGDYGNGKLYLCIETYAHENADRISQTLYLEQWDESRNDWVYVEDWEFSTTKEENDGELYDYIVELEVDGCEVGESYRARGSHLARVGSKTESFSSMTDGVTLTD